VLRGIFSERIFLAKEGRHHSERVLCRARDVGGRSFYRALRKGGEISLRNDEWTSWFKTELGSLARGGSIVGYRSSNFRGRRKLPRYKFYARNEILGADSSKYSSMGKIDALLEDEPSSPTKRKGEDGPNESPIGKNYWRQPYLPHLESSFELQKKQFPD